MAARWNFPSNIEKYFATWEEKFIFKWTVISYSHKHKRINNDGVTIFRRFSTMHFPKVIQKLSEGYTNVCEHCPKTSDEDSKMLRSRTIKFKYSFNHVIQMILRTSE